MFPPSGRGDIPCLIAFSTSGCKSIFGTDASSVSGSTLSRTRKRSRISILDPQILLEKIDLFFQCYSLHSVALKREAQQLAARQDANRPPSQSTKGVSTAH